MNWRNLSAEDIWIESGSLFNFYIGNRVVSNEFHQLIVAQRRHMVIKIWANTSLCNGLLPNGIGPLSELILTSHQWGPWHSGWMREILVCLMTLEIVLVEILLYLLRAIGLTSVAAYLHIHTWETYSTHYRDIFHRAILTPCKQKWWVILNWILISSNALSSFPRLKKIDK